jgi:hypothetical protein
MSKALILYSFVLDQETCFTGMKNNVKRHPFVRNYDDYLVLR